MQSVDDFMQEFLTAQQELRRQFAELEKKMWARFAVPDLHPNDLTEIQKRYDEFTMVETFKEWGELASVIATTVRPSQSVTRARYTLCRVEDGWRINCLEWSCKLCEGKRKITDVEGKEHACMVCKGTGWFIANPL